MAYDTPVVVFPSYLREDAYKYRKMVISIKAAPEFSTDVQAVYDKVINEIGELGDVISKTQASNTGSAQATHETLKKYHEKMNIGETVTTIALPLPNELQDNQSHDWSEDKGVVGTLGSVLYDTSVGGINVNKFLGSMSDQTGMRKPMADPGYFQNYEGSKPRNWTFTFDLIPNSPAEAGDMYEILYILRQYSLPDSTMDGVSIVAPHFFDIELSNYIIDDLMDMKGVVMTNMTIDWGADGNMQFLPDGTPKYIKLTLSFAERKMRTAAMFYQ